MLSPIAWRKLVRILQTIGFDGPFSGGRHFFMTRGTFKAPYSKSSSR